MANNNEKLDVRNRTADGEKARDANCSSKERKIALQQDVDKLLKTLRREKSVHRALERAFTRPLGSLPRLPPFLPPRTLELVAEVAVLEEEVIRLEEQVADVRQGLYQEAVYIFCSRRSIKNALNLCSHFVFHAQNQGHSEDCHNGMKFNTAARHTQRSAADDTAPSAELSSQMNSIQTEYLTNQRRNRTRCSMKVRSCSLSSGNFQGNENQSIANSTEEEEGDGYKSSRMMASQKIDCENNCSEKYLYPVKLQLNGRRPEKKRVKETFTHSLQRSAAEVETPNKLSEDILKCLMSILLRISTHKSAARDSQGRARECPEEIEFQDPYRTCSEYMMRDIGPYKHFHVVEANSVSSTRITCCSFLVQRLKVLLRKLESIDLQDLTHEQKLSFWINIYNSCMMNAYLEHETPGSPENVVALMQKATINVSGHFLNATTIEHFVLRRPSKYQGKAGINRYFNPHSTPSQALKNSEMIKRNALQLERQEPLVSFALSCGSWSSPAVRVYTSQVESELEAAKRDYLQAAVSISPTKATIPKILDWYLLDFAKDMESLLDWICLQLPSGLGKKATENLESRRKANLQVQVKPYDFSFRYLLAHQIPSAALSCSEDDGSRP